MQDIQALLPPCLVFCYSILSVIEISLGANERRCCDRSCDGITFDGIERLDPLLAPTRLVAPRHVRPACQLQPSPITHQSPRAHIYGKNNAAPRKSNRGGVGERIGPASSPSWRARSAYWPAANTVASSTTGPDAHGHD